MDKIKYGIKFIKDNIPEHILNLAFKEKTGWRDSVASSLDERIKNTVIISKVLIDTNAVGGVEMEIPISACTIKYSDDYSTVISIPKKATKNRNIVSGNMLYNKIPKIASNGIADTAVSESSSILDDLNKVTSADDMVVPINTARLELVGSNTIFIDMSIIGCTNPVIKVTVEHSNNLTEISNKSIIKFGELCRLAAWSLIYNKLVIKLDKGSVYSGHELGVVKELVTDNAQSSKEYIEYLTTTWKKAVYHSDNKKLSKQIGMMLTGV